MKLHKIGLAAATAAFALIAGPAQGAENLLYDWNAVNAATTPVAGYVPAPFVNDTNATSAGILAQLAAQQAATPGRVAIKVTPNQTLSPASIAALFNNPNFTINYAFYDIETGGPAVTTPLAQQQAQAIHAQPGGAGTRVGNYRLFPGNGDNSGVGAGPSLAEYTSGGPTGVNMANPDLYPGSPFYKDPAGVGGTSTSPNIRSSLFTLPVKRLTYTTSNIPSGHQIIPYVNRFNNFGNNELDSDANAGNGYAFNQNAADPTKGQLLSRGDFKALVAHYRLRGADGIHLLDGGVVGYSQAQFEQDGKDGWQIPQVSSIFAAADAKIASLDTVIKTGGTTKDFETAGVVFSGVYSLTQNKLALLLSNLTEAPTSVEFPARIAGKIVAGSHQVGEGEHRLLEFTGVGTQWVLSANTPLFTSAADTNRNGIGVPEPVALGSLSLVAMGALFRRSRRA
ncbi:MAG TPA: PEP-CTERM sorting domain-containing protein [Tepidisphaeraceae bacterium]|nr:PEP-CTERM sorting domain-containing protein [Tepidisphaeraceae bacterium]